jgi:hypothetical protein
MSKPEQTYHPFEKALAVCSENLEGILQNFPVLPWPDFWLNPRRLRGSDFLMRWSQGVWSEQRLIEAVSGGRLSLSSEALEQLRLLAARRK